MKQTKKAAPPTPSLRKLGEAALKGIQAPPNHKMVMEAPQSKRQ